MDDLDALVTSAKRAALAATTPDRVRSLAALVDGISDPTLREKIANVINVFSGVRLSQPVAAVTPQIQDQLVPGWWDRVPADGAPYLWPLFVRIRNLEGIIARGPRGIWWASDPDADAGDLALLRATLLTGEALPLHTEHYVARAEDRESWFKLDDITDVFTSPATCLPLEMVVDIISGEPVVFTDRLLTNDDPQMQAVVLVEIALDHVTGEITRLQYPAVEKVTERVVAEEGMVELTERLSEPRGLLYEHDGGIDTPILLSLESVLRRLKTDRYWASVYNPELVTVAMSPWFTDEATPPPQPIAAGEIRLGVYYPFGEHAADEDWPAFFEHPLRAARADLQLVSLTFNMIYPFAELSRPLLHVAEDSSAFFSALAARFRRMTHLHIQNTTITQIPDVIANANTVHNLSIAAGSLNFPIRKVSRKLYEMHLDTLALKGLNRDALPDRIDVGPLWTSLQTLLIEDCWLERMPSGFNSLSSLRSLTVIDAESLRFDEGLIPAQQTLVLKSVDLEWTLPRMRSTLTTLDITTPYPRWDSLPSMVFNLDGLQQLNNLYVLRLDGLGLRDFEVSEGGLANLVHLHLDNNRLGLIPDDVADLPSLKRLSITNNPLRTLEVNVDTKTWPDDVFKQLTRLDYEPLSTEVGTEEQQRIAKDAAAIRDERRLSHPRLVIGTQVRRRLDFDE